jgi:hypothetical protein
LLTGWDSDGKFNLLNNKFKLGNGCGYNTTTKNYTYLYWPGPDLSAIYVNFTDDPLIAFKYSMCVSTCPGNDSTPVLCKMPQRYFNESTKFIDC